MSEPPHPEETASSTTVTRPMETSLRMGGAYSGSVREDGGMLEIAPGLRRWTARHEDWEEDVGSLAVETSDGLVLIDPIDPPGEVRRPTTSRHRLLARTQHGRARREARLGFGALEPAARKQRDRRDRPVSCGRRLPGGIRAFQTARAAEVVYWLPDQRALVVGDVLLGAGAKPRATSDPLRLCPERCGEGNTRGAAQDTAATPRSAGRKRARLARRSDPQRRQQRALATALDLAARLLI